MNSASSSDITRIVLLVLFIGLLLAGSFMTLLPFIGALIWAVTIVAATWRLMLRVQGLVGGRRSIAVTIMTILVLLAFIAPLLLAIGALLNAAERSPALVRDFLSHGLGPVPQWLANLPIVGDRISARWAALAAGGPEALVEAIKPHARAIAAWVVSATGGLGMTIVQVLLAAIIVAILYAKGETAARGTVALARRIGGDRGEQTVTLAGQAIRSVALGVVVTALIQSSLAGLGLWVSGVPHAPILAALAFVFGIAQIGPLPILIPAVIWLYWTGSSGWATALLVWSVPVLALDNILRPILIRRGVELPLLLIIAGVIGGLITFGVIGLFAGPVILAATYTLMLEWVAEGAPAPNPEFPVQPDEPERDSSSNE